MATRAMAQLPAAMLARAQEFLAAGPSAPVAPARPAATVVLLRDPDPDPDPDRDPDHGTAAGIEVYLLRRAATMAFAAGMHVFPGGSVDPRDAESVASIEAAAAWAGPPAAAWGDWLGCDPALAGALVLAAVRETFEESGVLLAGPDADSVLDDTAGGDLERDRLALLDRSLSMAQVLARHGLVLRSDLLRPYAHWITPEFEPKRFDTRFFLAMVPPGQRPRDVSGEADDTLWLPVRDAVARHEAGVLAMLAPTIEALRDLAASPTVADALLVAPSLLPRLPRLVDGRPDGDQVHLVLDERPAAPGAEDRR